MIHPSSRPVPIHWAFIAKMLALISTSTVASMAICQFVSDFGPAGLAFLVAVGMAFLCGALFAWWLLRQQKAGDAEDAIERNLSIQDALNRSWQSGYDTALMSLHGNQKKLKPMGEN